jgi:methylglutaconyl-CoA hydratase
MQGHVTSHIEHGINTIEFFHPKSNSLPLKILQALAQEIELAGHSDATKVIILKSAGDKSFCAGASFDELVSIQTAEEGLAFFSGFALVLNAMRKCPKMIIGSIQGPCVGGGVGLAAAADYAISTTTASIKLSELAVGIGPFVVAPAIQRKIGNAAFSTLATDATNWRSSQWALQHNLFAEVHDTIESMNESVIRLSNTLTNSSPEAMAEMKQIFWEGTEHWDQLLTERAAISGRLVLSDFTRNAIEKFKQSKK